MSCPSTPLSTSLSEKDWNLSYHGSKIVSRLPLSSEPLSVISAMSFCHFQDEFDMFLSVMGFM